MNTNYKRSCNSIESPARQLALSALLAVEKGTFAEQAINDGLEKTLVSVKDRALFTELVYGVTRNRIYLDHVVDRFLKKPSKKMSPILRLILRLGSYQIIYLDRIPPRAVVNESTIQAQRLLSGIMAGLVNGVLRKISENREDLKKEPANEANELGKFYSHPEWLVLRWLNEYGPLETTNILRFNNSRPSLVIRVNTNKIPFENFLQNLDRQNIKHGKIYPDFDSIEIRNLGQPVSSIDGYSSGHFLVQDIASQIIPGLLKIGSDHRVLDSCAAPGNKTFHIGSALGAKGKLTVCDLSRHRLNETQHNLLRLGVTNFESVCGDCSDEHFVSGMGLFDRILVDAPCSSLGVLRHNPEAKFCLNPQTLEEHSRKQLKILQTVSKLMAPTGLIVYSVCSTAREETWNVVEKFVLNNPDFEVDPIVSGNFPSEVRIDDNGMLWTFPPSHDIPLDGFFAARFRRS